MLARAETDLDFYSRRAMEEARAAARATNVAAGAAHRHMAAIYAARLQEEGFGEMLDEPDARPAVDEDWGLDLHTGDEDARHG